MSRRLGWVVAVCVCGAGVAGRSGDAATHEADSERAETYRKKWLAAAPERCAGEPCEWLRRTGPADVGCTLSFRVGLYAHDSANSTLREAGPLIVIKTKSPFGVEETLILRPHSFAAASRFDTVPVLCAIGGGPREARAHVLMVVNSARYLFHQWPNFVNKVLFAKRSGLGAAVWIGELSKGLATTVEVPGECDLTPGKPPPPGKSRLPAPRADARALTSAYFGRVALNSRRVRVRVGSIGVVSRESGSSAPETGLGPRRRPGIQENHHSKIVAAYAALGSPRVTAVYYVDLDVVASRGTIKAARPGAQQEINAKVDLEFDVSGTQNNTYFWRTSSARFFAKSSPTARAFLALWITHRCGFKDQRSLWHATMLAAAAACPKVRYADEVMAISYVDAKHFPHRQQHKRGPLPNLDVSCADRVRKCPTFQVCLPNQTPLAQLIHKSVRAERSLRRFYYTDAQTGAPRQLDVMDMHYALLDDDAPHKRVSNRKFLYDLSIDLFADHDVADHDVADHGVADRDVEERPERRLGDLGDEARRSAAGAETRRPGRSSRAADVPG